MEQNLHTHVNTYTQGHTRFIETGRTLQGDLYERDILFICILFVAEEDC